MIVFFWSELWRLEWIFFFRALLFSLTSLATCEVSENSYCIAQSASFCKAFVAV